MSEASSESEDEDGEEISVSKISLESAKSDHDKEINSSSYSLAQTQDIVQEQEAQEKSQRFEQKLDALVDEYVARQQQLLYDEVIERATVESGICEFIRDKLVNDEVSLLMRSVCASSLDEERREAALKEARTRQELRDKLQLECVEALVNETTERLMRECCERVLLELKNERALSVYETLLDEVMPRMLERTFLEFMFDEMIVKDKPLIPRPLVTKEVVTEKKIFSAVPSKSQTTNEKKRRISSVSSSPPDIGTGPNGDENVGVIIPLPAKKVIILFIIEIAVCKIFGSN